jgi:hypothetical protein
VVQIIKPGVLIPQVTITFAISGGGTGATVTGLPSGVNGIYSGGTFTMEHPLLVALSYSDNYRFL